MLIRKLFPTRLLLGVLAVFLGYQALVMVLPGPRRLSPAEQAAVRAAAGNLAGELEKVVEEMPRLGIARFVSDSGDEVTAAVRARLAEDSENTPWRVREGSVIAGFLSDIYSTVAGATTPDEVIHAGRRVGLDMVVGGQVREVTTTTDGATAVIRAVVYDFRQGRLLMNENITGVWRGDPPAEAVAGWRGLLPGPLGWLVWIGVVLLLPWLTAALVRLTVEQQSNTVSAVLLGGYTAAAILLGMILVGFPFAAPAGTIGAAVVIILFALYNYRVSERIAGGDRRIGD